MVDVRVSSDGFFMRWAMGSAAVLVAGSVLVAGLSLQTALAQAPVTAVADSSAAPSTAKSQSTAQPGDPWIEPPLVTGSPGETRAHAADPGSSPDSSPLEIGPGETEPDSTFADDRPPPEIESEPTAPEFQSRGEEIARFEQQLSRFEVSEADAAKLFNQFRDETRMRLWQFAMALNTATSTEDVVRIDPAQIEVQHPGFPVEAYRLPSEVITVRDLYLDTLAAFTARNYMLGLISPELREEAVGSALYGMQELRSDRDLIIVEIRYQALRVPRAFQQIKRMALQAPVPLIWITLEFWFAILLFRWWRRWLPGTLARMRTSLLAIRPRTEEILTRLRGLWYINQVRPPLEWLILWTFLFSLLQFDGLDFIRDVGMIVVRWIMLTWFAVALLNAYVARGAGGLAGESARLRMMSMRLIAGWMLLLGVSIDLSTDLVGDAAVTAWIWHIFQLLIFPLVCGLLSIWHIELYTRLEREGEPTIPREEYAAQRGLRRWVGSAQVLGLLMASGLRAVLIRRIEQFGPVRVAAGLALPDEAEEATSEAHGIPAELRETLIKGHDAFSKFALHERMALVKRIDAGVGGVVGVIGERGIGKNGFLRQVASAHEHGNVLLDCRNGSAADVVADFGRQLGLDMATTDDAALNAALEAQNIRFIGVFDLHLLVRPVMGGIGGVAELSELQERITVPVVWAVSVDRYAYQLIARLRAEYMLADALISLRAWSEEQIGEFVQNRYESAELKPDFSKVKVPRQYMDVAQDAIEDRNRVGIYTMLTALSRGNPSIAIRLFADCIRMTDDGVAEVTLPANRDDQRFKDQPINLLLVLRVIAQVELITIDDIVSNLRLEPRVVTSALQVAVSSGWVEVRNGRYRISWPWFRVITQVLGRQNLLAGVREGSA